MSNEQALFDKSYESAIRDLEAAEKRIAELEAELAGYKAYAAVNPLGGPAAMLEAAAARVRAGDE